ncbi:lactococcin 972 family bacteriocin [Streptomyces sp. NPDC048255]|uniref:lactococcin 972 family bacteriocin n=1 Tax=Streptomyces sp. NPDC048255 TaxID=3154713 RepID=UPI0034035FE0
MRIKVALATAALVVAAATPAMAVVVNTGGGKWDYGVSDGFVWSNYYHADTCHSSSVQGDYYSSSGNVGAGSWSYASATDAWSGNKSWWSKGC